MAMPVVPKLNLDVGWKMVAFIVGFFVFLILMISLGIFAVTNSLAMAVGIFILIVVNGAAFLGRLSFKSPIYIGGLVIGAFLAMVNPTNLTIATLDPVLPSLETHLKYIKEVTIG